jgi:hypothetical protein
VQLPFATGKSFTVDGLREKLRELFRQEVGAELRAGAALNNVESYRAHFFQLAGRPYRPSVAHSQRGGFAADYLGRKQALAASARTEWREQKSSNDNGDPRKSKVQRIYTFNLGDFNSCPRPVCKS